MSTQPTEGAATEAQGTIENEATTGTEQPKPTETVEFWREKAREQEKRAKSNAEAAKRLAEIEEAQKTEAQKAADALAKAEERAAAAEAKALSLDIATEHKLGKEDAALLAALPDEDSMRALAKRLAGQAAEQKQNGNQSPREGNNPRPVDDPVRNFTRGLFGEANI